MTKKMPKKLKDFLHFLELSGVENYTYDEPVDQVLGEWFIDIKKFNEIYTLSFKNFLGFGFYSHDCVYGEKPISYIKNTKEAIRILEIQQVIPKINVNDNFIHNSDKYKTV